jgi:hypothetical protein
MAAPIELPMALADCGLDQAQLAEQLARYRRLGARAVECDRSELALTVRFAADAEPEPDLRRRTIAVERECCSFFALHYDQTQRLLTVSVEDLARRSALDAIEAAIRSGAGPARHDGRRARPAA